jgi:hypothetical protein
LLTRIKQSMAAKSDSRIKMLLQFNGGGVTGDIPVAFFQGGPSDFPAAGVSSTVSERE